MHGCLNVLVMDCIHFVETNLLFVKMIISVLEMGLSTALNVPVVNGYSFFHNLFGMILLVQPILTLQQAETDTDTWGCANTFMHKCKLRTGMALRK